MSGIEMLREWAKELREAARAYRDGEIGYVPIDVEACQRKNAARLDAIADQIERETKHTCRNLSNDGDVFVCSECRNETHGFMFDDFGCTVGFGLGVGRCPNCGAKVVIE